MTRNAMTRSLLPLAAVIALSLSGCNQPTDDTLPPAEPAPPPTDTMAPEPAPPMDDTTTPPPPADDTAPQTDNTAPPMDDTMSPPPPVDEPVEPETEPTTPTPG